MNLDDRRQRENTYSDIDRLFVARCAAAAVTIFENPRIFNNGLNRMKKITRLAAATLLASALLPVAASAATPATYNWTTLGNTLDGFVTKQKTPPEGKVNGYSFELVSKTGVLYSRAGGNIKAGTVVPLASSSKLPAAVAILTLTNAGRLNLDAPISGFLAGSAVSWPADKAAITMRMLLNHTSGLPGLNDNYPSCINNENSETFAQCVQEVANSPLVYTPGTAYDYGGADYQVAGYVAMWVASASSWEAFFKSAVAKPLNLSTLTWGNPNTLPNPRIAGGAQSAVADYAGLLQVLLNDGMYGTKQFLRPGTVTNALELNQIEGLPILNFAPVLSPTDFPGYSFGLFNAAPFMNAPSTGTEFSDPGSTGPAPWFDTGLGYGAVLLINDDSTTGIDMWNAARPLIIQQMTAN